MVTVWLTVTAVECVSDLFKQFDLPIRLVDHGGEVQLATTHQIVLRISGGE